MQGSYTIGEVFLEGISIKLSEWMVSIVKRWLFLSKKLFSLALKIFTKGKYSYG